MEKSKFFPIRIICWLRIPFSKRNFLLSLYLKTNFMHILVFLLRHLSKQTRWQGKNFKVEKKSILILLLHVFIIFFSLKINLNSEVKKSKQNTKMSARNRPQIKLTYFDLNARAALPRLVLAVANVKYEDERIKVKF